MINISIYFLKYIELANHNFLCYKNDIILLKPIHTPANNNLK